MREEDFGILIFDSETFRTLVINKSGGQILCLCNGFYSLSEILSSIEPNNEDVLNNTKRFLENLISVGIVKEVDNNE